MRQVWITRSGGAEALELRETADPAPQEHELRIRVRASGVNFADILARQGLYPDAPKRPCVVGYEVAGTVDAVGANTDPAWLDQEVLALTRFGGYADVVVVPEHQVFHRPASLTLEQCAALPVNYLTAWQLMVVMGALAKEDTVLIHNAGGGVGLAAIDIGRHLGARMIGTASAGKHAGLRERGLHDAIDYTRQDWLPEVERLTQGRGPDLILDPLGGAHWKKSYRALRHTGRLGMFGASTITESNLPGPLRLLKVGAQLPWFNPISLMNKNRSVFGVNLGHLWHEPEKMRRWMTEILRGVDAGWVRPHVDKAFALTEVAAAHAHIEARRNYGKVILTT